MFNIVKPVFARPGSTGDDIIGSITVPSGIPTDVAKGSSFLTAIITLVIVVAGLFTLWQFISGGLSFITSNGDKNKVLEANNKITYALIGIAIIAASFIIAGILGLILYGSFDALLNPKFVSVQ